MAGQDRHTGRPHVEPRVADVGRRINAERIVLLGWTRAILLQFAHPLIAAAIADHSGFRSGSWAAIRRLHLTVGAMLDVTFGSESRSQRALAGILTIHRRVHGYLPRAVGPFPSGTRYSAEDPSLVLWVHATLMESLPVVYDLLVAPLETPARDTYCRDAAQMAVALGTPAADVPQSAAGIRSYIDGMYASGAITVGDQARALAAALLRPPFGSLGLPAARINARIAVGLLPPHIRAQYGFPWTPQDERALARTVMALRTARALVPDRLAQWGAARRRPA